MANENEEIIMTGPQAVALAQLLTWLRGGLEEVVSCIVEHKPERLAGLCRILLGHPCVVADLVTMDELVDRICQLDGRATGAEHRAAVRVNIRRQADLVMAQMEVV